jgi:FkbM family methyltransferase
MNRSLSRIFERDEIYLFLCKFSQQYKNINLLQIGANDGLRNDPIREFIVANPLWQGTLIEPVPSMMKQMQKNYAYTNTNSRLRFENVAIAPQSEFVYLWKIKDNDIHHLPDYAQGMISFDKKHFFENIHIEVKDEWLEKILVPCKPLKSIVKEMNNQVDLVVIDVEGMEETVLLNFPFDACSPLCFIYESKHCDDNEYKRIENFLGEQGYVCFKAMKDTIVLRNDIKQNENLNINKIHLKANRLNA